METFNRKHMNTPRTDENLVNISGAGLTVNTLFVYAEFARQLERELVEANKRIEALEEEVYGWELGSRGF